MGELRWMYPWIGWALALVAVTAMIGMGITGKRRDTQLRAEVASLRSMLAATPTDGMLLGEVERLRDEVKRLHGMVDEVLGLNSVLRSQVNGLQADRHNLELSLAQLRGRIGQ